MTHIGYIKRISADTYRSQRRGGKGISALSTRENAALYRASVHDDHPSLSALLHEQGQGVPPEGLRNPGSGTRNPGYSDRQSSSAEPDEQITTMIAVRDFDEDKNLLMATKYGIVKQTHLKEYDSSRKNGLIAINLKEGDELIRVRMTDQEDQIIMGTEGRLRDPLRCEGSPSDEAYIPGCQGNRPQRRRLRDRHGRDRTGDARKIRSCASRKRATESLPIFRNTDSRNAAARAFRPTRSRRRRAISSASVRRTTTRKS